MKLVLVLGAAAIAAGAAFAEPTSCIDPHRSYIARPLNSHDVFAQSSIGTPKPPVRFKTSCIHLDPAIGVSLSSPYNCVGLGDPVVATTADGKRESCIVTKVLPYKPEDGDIKK